MNSKKIFWKVGTVSIVVFFMCLAFSFMYPLDALADEFPTKPIKLICPMAPGGSHDATSRAFCSVAHQYFGVPVVTIIKSGGGGSIGANYVAQSKPDGHTLLFAAQKVLIARPLIVDLPYTHKSFVSVGRINYSPMTLVAHSDSPWKNLKELIAYAREHPNEVRCPSSSGGAIDQLTLYPLFLKAGAKIKFIPIQGAANQFKAFLSKDVDIGVFFPNLVGEYIKEGKIRPLAVASGKRDPLWPEIPTMKEQGFDHEFAMFRAIFAPKGVPTPRLKKLRECFTQTIHDKSFQSIIRRMGMPVIYMSGEDFDKFLVEEVERIKLAIKEIFK